MRIAIWQNKHKLFFMVTIMLAIGYVLLSKSSLKDINNSKGNYVLSTKNGAPSYIRSCSHSTNISIFYIKIQKTGSSTIKSMLLNYGLKKEMKICMDNTDLYHMNFPYRIDENRLINKPNGTCEMVADELVFDKNQALLMMSGRPLIITSLRDPITHFVSMYKFASVHHAVEMLTLLKLDFWDGVRVFLKNPDLVRSVYNTFDREEIHDFALQHLVRPNLQAFSFGLDSKLTDQEIETKINDIDIFILSERFYESVVLLAKRLCVPFEDLVFVRQNINHEDSTSRWKDVPPDVKEMIRKFNAVDYVLYKKAKDKFEASVNSYPKDSLDHDVEIYKNSIKGYARKCESIKQPLALMDGNYCLPEQAAYFYKLVREKLRKKLLRNLQEEYNKSNS